MSDLQRFTVGASCTIADVAGLVALWQAQLSQATPCDWLIDVSELEDVDGAGFQLLVSLIHTAAQRERPLQWQWMAEQSPAAWLKGLLTSVEAHHV